MKGELMVMMVGMVVGMVAVVSGQGMPWISVDPTTQQFKDSLGRVRLFHGVNAVYKVAPWLPDNGPFTAGTSLGPEDVALMQSWGFSVVRLGVMWPGVQPQSASQVNASYLKAARQMVDLLGSKGIYTIVDFHQDVFSRKFCGEGVPDWAVEPDPSLPAFALPTAPVLPVDPATGYPNLTQCLQRGFSLYYPTRQVSAAFQRLYDNAGGMQGALGNYWSNVAAAFADAPHVLGYELINEPWPGDVYAEPLLLVPGHADRVNLAPMYQRLNAAIRAVDERHVVFFEDALNDLAAGTGFTPALTPGGPSYQDRQALSFHTYCGPLDAEGDPRSSVLCDGEDEYFWLQAMADVRKVGAGSMMTEFGAVTNASTGLQELHFLTGLADRDLQSWAYWQYKSYNDITTSNNGPGESLFSANGQPVLDKVKALSRTYAMAVAGALLSQQFDPATSRFQLTFVQDPSVAAPTLVYLNQPLYYPNGFQTSLSTNSSAVTFDIVPSGPLLQISPSTTLTIPVSVTLIITVKK